jgi:hypothetical protein
MKSPQFEQHVEYLINKGYTREEVNAMTVGEIIILTNKLIQLEKGKEQ